MRSASIFLLLFVIGAVPHSLQAQASYGTILGTVSDLSGGVVPNASVTVTNRGTNGISKATTGSDGDYSVGNLLPGAYQVKVEVKGFKTFVASPLTLLVNQQLRVNAVLQPGAVTTTVNVSSAPQLVATDSNTVGGVVENKQMENLPLVGRNFVGLAALTPGVVNQQPPPAGVTTSTYGFLYSVDYWRTPLAGGALWVGGGRSDGNAYYIDGQGNNEIGFQTAAITPPIDAIQEFQIMTKNYSAEFGGSQAQIMIVTKSGTNSFHGTAYDFFRNDFLDARGFFDTTVPGTNVSKPILRYNQFGGSLGGPIKHDKWFFFGNYEGTRDHNYFIGRGIVPTIAELQGDFSALSTPIYNYKTGQPFAGNVIPPSDLSPKIQEWLKDPFLAPPNTSLPGGINLVSFLGNIDTINQETARVDGKLSDRDSLFVRASIQREGLVEPSVYPLNGLTFAQNGTGADVGWTHILSPHLVNQFRIGYLRPLDIETQQTGGKPYAQTLFTGLENEQDDWGTPAASISGYATYGSRSFGPHNFLDTDSSLADTISYTRGTHQITTGGEVDRIFYKPTNANGARGIFHFSGVFTAGPLNPTGNGVADFVLGLPQGIVNQVGLETNWDWGTWVSGFVQDNWKATRRLTLNLGFRYEFRQPVAEQQNRTGTVDLGYPGGRVCTPNQAVVAKYNDPYLGGDCSPRIFPNQYLPSPRIGFAYRPFSSDKTVVRGAYGIFYDTYQMDETGLAFGAPPWQTSQSLTYTPKNPPNIDTLFPVYASPAPLPPITALGVDQHNKTTNVQQWNLDVQRQLGSNWLFDVGYLGSRASYINQRNTPCMGELLASGKIVYPYYNMNACLISMTDSAAAYNAFTAQVKKHFSHGFNFQTAYTWSKNMSIGSDASDVAQNYYDRNADYGPSNYNVPQSVVISGMWDLPFGSGQRFGSNLRGVADKLTRGWQINGIYTIQSGFPYSISANDVAGTGGIWNEGYARANLVGNPHIPDPIDPTRALNRSAFAQPAVGTYGNSGVNILQGKGTNNLDFSLFKNTHVSERLNIQFRAEVFNLWNHVQLGPFPGSSITNQNSLGVYTTLDHNPRIVQLALKLIF